MSSGPQITDRPPSGPWRRFATARRVVPAILLLAIGLRLGLILAFPITPRTDSLWYLERGREIAAGMGYQESGFPTAFWPVGYPALIALATGIFGPTLFGPILFNLIAQAATILLILWFARALGAGEGAARLAALLYALYPAHIAYSGDTAAEATATAVMMAGMALVVKGRGRPALTRDDAAPSRVKPPAIGEEVGMAPLHEHPVRASAPPPAPPLKGKGGFTWGYRPGSGLGWALIGGLVLGAAMLMRPQIMLLPPFLVAALWLSRGVRWPRALLLLVVTVAGMAVVVAPWTMRNRAVLGAPVLVSTNGGVALQAGANDLADGGYFQVERSPLWVQVGIPFADRVERQVAIDRRLKTMATDWIADHPTRWGLLGFRKMALLWMKDGDGFWSLDASHPGRALLWKAAQGVNQLFYLAVVALAVIGTVLAARAAWAGRRGGAMLVASVLPVFCTVLAYGFTGQTRYHYPAMPFVMILAAWVMARWWEQRGEPSRASAAMPDDGRCRKLLDEREEPVGPAVACEAGNLGEVQRQVVGQDPVPGLRLHPGDRLVGLREFLQVIDARSKRVDVALRRADPQHVQDDLRVLGVVLVPAVVQRLARSGERDRRYEAQLEPRRQQPMCQRAMVVARRLEADDDGAADGRELLGKAVIVLPGGHDGQPPAPAAFGALDKDLLPVFGHVDGYQHGAGRRRSELGHGRSASKVLSRQPHFRYLLAGHGLP